MIICFVSLELLFSFALKHKLEIGCHYRRQDSLFWKGSQLMRDLVFCAVLILEFIICRQSTNIICNYKLSPPFMCWISRWNSSWMKHHCITLCDFGGVAGYTKFYSPGKNWFGIHIKDVPNFLAAFHKW